jgi:3-oxoadipate enol-lactonase
MGVSAVMRDVLLWAFTVPFFSEQTEMLKEFEAEMAAIDQPLEAYLAQLSSIRTHDTTDRIGTIAVPTLVLAGEQDILIPVSLSRELHAAIPGAEWATSPGGHACMWETPDPFNATVLGFLSRVSVGAAAQ